METKRDIGNRAKSLISSNPDEAVKLYKELQEVFTNEFNSWDAFYAMKALRASRNPDKNWAKELASNCKDEKVGNLYGWMVFDHCIKGKQKSEVRQNEQHILSLPKLSPQKNLREDNTYPCPTTISIFKLADAYAENLFNAGKINTILETIDYNLLSSDVRTVDTEQRGEIELASDLEKYFTLRTKALIKLKEYDACKELCKIALDSLAKLHFNNDLWFKMRIAIAEEGLGNFEESEALFKTLLSSKAGSDKWFLYRDIAEVYFEHNDYEKAWKYSVDAAYYGNEPHFLIGLYLLQARTLFKLERPNDGKVLAELIAAILKDQGWKNKNEYNRLFSFYKIDREQVQGTNEVFKRAKEFWNSERYGDKEKVKGSIFSIHRNGKVGRIKTESGKLINFHKKNLVSRVHSLTQLEKAEINFYEIEGEDGNFHAEVIEVVNHRKKEPIKTDLVGKILEGTVKSTIDFGIFVLLPKLRDGLLHKNNLPEKFKETFQANFKSGDIIKVRIFRVTEKGLQLSLLDNE